MDFSRTLTILSLQNKQKLKIADMCWYNHIPIFFLDRMTMYGSLIKRSYFVSKEIHEGQLTKTPCHAVRIVQERFKKH